VRSVSAIAGSRRSSWLAARHARRDIPFLIAPGLPLTKRFTAQFERRKNCDRDSHGDHRAAGWLMTVLAAVFGPIHAAHAEAINVEIEIQGLRSAKGGVLVAAHATRDTFPGNWSGATAFAKVSAAPGSVQASLRLPAPGRYALIVVHDEDGNGIMTKNFIGLPTEGYVTGRNADSLEFPLFERSRRDLVNGQRLALKLLYP
jgi:uncharacterized protein (DUF2141 family)